MAELVVTIDGPAGVGKSTVSKMLAQRLGAKFLDTGAMYRAVTAAALRRGIDLSDEQALLSLLRGSSFEFVPAESGMQVIIDGEDFTELIRTEQVSRAVKKAADSKAVRAELVQKQRDFAQKAGKVVTEGRDQGTVVFPDADYKFYLTADANERAKRRVRQLQHMGEDADFDEVLAGIVQRDKADVNREVGALKCAEGAVVIDTAKLTAEEVVERMLEIIQGERGRRGRTGTEDSVK